MDFDPEAKTVVGLSVGQHIFGRFALDRVLGQGAMGVVWLADDAVMGEQVALKFLPPVLASDPAALEEMKEEARQSRRLTHEHIVRIHDLVTDDQAAAISMEWVDGLTFSAMRLKRPGRFLEVADLAPLLAQICPALDYAHRRARVAHRDLKPSNIMVTKDGFVKITDFGIARSLTDSVTRLTRAGTSGTPSYMSPQQMMGKRPSPADDLYALGATLYEMLTGKPPFFTGDLGMQVLHAAPPSLAERRRELGVEGNAIPVDWENAIQRCLAKNPDDRPASAGDLLELLQINPETPAAPLSALVPESNHASSEPGTTGSSRASRSSRGGERTRQQFAGFLDAGKFREARTLLLSPLLDEQQTQKLRAQLQGAVAKAWEALVEQLTALIREERFSEGRERLREWRKRVPEEMQAVGLDGVEGMLVQVVDHGDLAAGGAWSELRDQRRCWTESERTPGVSAVIEEASDTVVFESAMHRAEDLLLQGQLPGACRLLEGLRDSGLCKSMTQNLASRVEMIRTETNDGVKRELQDLESQVVAGTLSNEAVSKWISGLRTRYLPGSSGSDPVLRQLDALERGELSPSHAEPPPLTRSGSPVDEPPPLPVQVDRSQAVEAASSPSLGGESDPSVSSGRGLGFLVWAPILAALLVGSYLGGFRPYEQGKADLGLIEQLLEDGDIEGAEAELADLESRMIARWMLAPAIRELRKNFGNLDGLDDLADRHPGLRNALAEFRRAYPAGPVESFSGTWEELGATIGAALPGTVLLLETEKFFPTSWISVEKPIAIIGAAAKTEWVVDVMDQDDPVMEIFETDALLAGIHVVQSESDETEGIALYIEGSRVWLSSLSIVARTLQGIEVIRSELTANHLEVVVAGKTGLKVEDGLSRITVDNSRFHGCGIGVVIAEGAQGRLRKSSLTGNTEFGAIAIKAGSVLELSEVNASGNKAGVAAIEGSTLRVLDSVVENNTDWGMLAAGASGRIEATFLTGNEVGLVVGGTGSAVEGLRLVISENRAEGVFLEEGAIINLSDCAILRNGGTGVLAEFSNTEITLSNSDILYNSGSGVAVFEGSRVRVEQTMIKWNTGHGVVVSGAGTIGEIVDVELTGNGLEGLRFTKGGRGWVEQSRLQENMVGILVSGADTDARVLGNVIESSREHGIVVDDDAYAEILDSFSNSNQGSGLVASGVKTRVLIARSSLEQNRKYGIESWRDASVQELEAVRLVDNQSGTRNR